MGLRLQKSTISVRVNIRSRFDPKTTYLAVQNIRVRIPLDAELDVGRVTRRSIWLRHDIARPDLPLQQWLQPPLLLSLGTIFRQQLHISRVWSGVVGSLGSRPRPSELLAHEAVLQVGESGALLVVALCEKHVPETQLLGLLLEVIHDGRVAPSSGSLAELCVIDGVGGEAFFVDEFLDLDWCSC